jgi:hypothetical protein
MPRQKKSDEVFFSLPRAHSLDGGLVRERPCIRVAAAQEFMV